MLQPKKQTNNSYQPSQPSHISNTKTSVTPRLSSRDSPSINLLPPQGSLKYLESKSPINGIPSYTFSSSSRSLLTKDPLLYSPKRTNTVLTPSYTSHNILHHDHGYRDSKPYALNSKNYLAPPSTTYTTSNTNTISNYKPVSTLSPVHRNTWTDKFKENYDLPPTKVRSPLKRIVVYSHQQKESAFANIDKEASTLDPISKMKRSPSTNRIILEERI
jgi:hypothetical protein